MAAIPESAKLFMTGLIERARKLKKTIAFPEGTDARVLEAAARPGREGGVEAVRMVAGACRAGLHGGGVPRRARLVSSVFIMALRDATQGHHGLMAFADCAVMKS